MSNGNMERNVLYAGKHELLFDKKKHVYLLKGVVIPSATSILRVLNKPALIGWSAKMASQHWYDNLKPGTTIDELTRERLLKSAKVAHRGYSDERKTAGTLVHEWVESYVQHKLKAGPEPDMPTHGGIKECVEQFLAWEKMHHPEWLHAERKVLSVQNGHCGTTDLIALVHGLLETIDLKTGKGVYAEAGLQLASYGAAISEEMGNGGLGGDGDPVRRILHLPLGGKLSDYDEDRIAKELTGHGIADDYGVFLMLMEVYKWDRGVQEIWRKNNPYRRKTS